MNKKPIRTCAFCGVKRVKNEMIRFLLDQQGVPIIDPTGKKSGRGVNICAKMDCFLGAIQEDKFEQAWGIDDSPNRDNLKDNLKQLTGEFKKAVRRKSFRKGRKHIVYRVKEKDLKRKLEQKNVQSK
jgi:hypothetical protein